MKEYTITPINTGMVNSNKANYLYHNSTHKYYDVEGNIQLPVTVFLVQSEDRKILIDTGMSVLRSPTNIIIQVPFSRKVMRSMSS